MTITNRFKISKAELKYHIWGMLILACFLIYFITRTAEKKNSLKKEQSYTVGLCIGIREKGIKETIPSVIYKYSIDKIDYSESHGFNPKLYKPEIGRIYLVMYSPRNPGNSRIMLKEILNDSIKAPIEGWANVPFGIKDSLDVEW